eukprot:CAMPEP_0183314014 /NCGR_PEP_ID=MMETSP0160_2-20130417/47208_1 /TAXON_ID=2839 ORGANISM="Odontella Sinensis, Strain Grunow 1884" /NCGR_SAMPLE_ID=MMETSP0160_2 /ASSEMBLY_ACC=CAM_ASM_000250 /LENGTH=600 /DNA_ID=CAMNT_0025479233 /DNA_START=42 /DNA_END=1841 /DNA_ORIENTATION=-
MSDNDPEIAPDDGVAGNRNLPDSLRRRNRAVAEREASRLARPEGPRKSSTLGHASRSKSAVSSTPFGFGLLQKSAKTSDEGEGGVTEDWCGPFSVARQMIAAREDARAKREAEQKEREESADYHPLDEIIEEVEIAKKRKENPSIQWQGNPVNEHNGRSNYYVIRKRRYAQQQRGVSASAGGKIPSLFHLCIDLLVEYFDDVEALGDVGVDIRRAICESLVAKGKMNGAAFEAIAETGIEALELVDCAEVTQDQLSRSLAALIPAGLRALILNHAGRCFGPKAVQAIVSCPGKSLFAISIGGAYLMKDSDAAALIEATSGTLSSVSFKACPLIGLSFCNSIADYFGTCSGGGSLLELSLEEMPLSKESLLALGSSDALRNLKSLCLKQVEGVDDDVVTFMLCQITSLESIDLSNNISVTDTSLSVIRKNNESDSLRALQLSGIRNITAAGLEAFFMHDIPGLPNPPMLRKLDLSACDEDVVNDAVLELALKASLSKHASNGTKAHAYAHVQTTGLVHLNISGSCITDKSMENLAAHCSSSLTELDVSFCPKVSDKGLGYLVSKAEHQFNKIHVWGNAQITDEFLDGHSRVGEGFEIIGAW